MQFELMFHKILNAKGMWTERIDLIGTGNTSYEGAAMHALAPVLPSSGKIPNWFKWALKDPYSLCGSLDLETYLQWLF